MLRVLIEGSPLGGASAAQARAEFRAALRHHPELARSLRAKFFDTEAEREARLAKADAFLVWRFPTADLAHRAPNLKWIQLTGAGFEHLLPLDWLPEGVRLANCSGVHGPKVAEFATMALLMLHTGMPFFATAQRAHRWAKRYTPLIGGQTAVVVGLGGMGGAAARSARKLGLEVIGVNRSGRPSPAADRTLPVEKLHQALPKADFLVLAAPLTGRSRGLIGKRELGLLKPTAGLINIGRGALVDEAALIQALKRGRLAGAILDVFATEPLPADSPLWDTPNLTIMPHVSSDDAALYMPRNYDLFLRNCKRFLSNRQLINAIDPAMEY
jgi:phosphoglycerate dehydrogenase-like enzyme